jgi:DNA-3-methyladenine glycosylase II
MNIVIPVTQPFDFQQTLTFVRRFVPCHGDFLLTDDSLTAAITVDGRAVPFTLRAHRGVLRCETEVAAVAERAADFVGARDDVAGFYAAANGDSAFAPLLARLHGLHHVRFLTLAEIAVYSVMMQRRSVEAASRMKQRFLARFGVPAGALRAMPELATLCALEPAAIGAAIGHVPKGATIATVVRGVAALGETFLRTAPYADARDRRLEIRGIGTFSAAAILLSGLGRMDELPAVMPGFADEVRAIYGRHDDREIDARYGRHVGYWSFYLKTGLPRLLAGTPGPGRLASGSRRFARANVAA